MIPNDFTVATADWANEDDRNACRMVREQVYILEQKVREEDEWDEFDEPSRHVLARDAQGNPIGTGRLTPNMMIGRMAVLREWRGREVGAMILGTLLEQARAMHYPSIELHAQTQAVRVRGSAAAASSRRATAYRRPRAMRRFPHNSPSA